MKTGFSPSFFLAVMLRAIKTVSEKTNDVIARRGGDQCTLQDITNVIEAYTRIDEIHFVGYESEPDNPLWGEFQRWEQFEPYKGERTIVEVRYAKHLNVPWRRFVVCKELCHALDSRRGTHTAGDIEVSDLITELALSSAAAPNGSMSLAGSAETIAQAGAIEILLPLQLRIELAGGSTNSVDENCLVEISTRHDLPLEYVRMAFRPVYMTMMANIFSQM